MHRNLTLILLMSFVVIVVRPGTIDTPDNSQVVSTNASSMNASDTDADATDTDSSDTDQSVEDRIRSLRIEMLKIQILSKLKMEKPPPAAEPPSEFSREAIRLLLQQEAEEQPRIYRQYESNERLIIHSKGNGRECLKMKENFCKMFRYEINASLNMSAMDLWIYKLGEFPKWISVSVSFFSNLNEQKHLDRFYFKQPEMSGWNKLPLGSILLPTSWNDTVSYQVEISGDNIGNHGDHRPFLMVSKSYSAASRRRRDVNCDTNESCCVKPLRVSLAEIGFSWVLYPLELEANMCAGTCRMDQGALRTHYERAMTKVIENDLALQGLLGECWTLCCKPKQLEAVRVIYNDTDGIIHDQYIPELIVKSCSCS